MNGVLKNFFKFSTRQWWAPRFWAVILVDLKTRRPLKHSQDELWRGHRNDSVEERPRGRSFVQ